MSVNELKTQNATIFFFFFWIEFQLMVSISNNYAILSSDQDTNWFLV